MNVVPEVEFCGLCKGDGSGMAQRRCLDIVQEAVCARKPGASSLLG